MSNYAKKNLTKSILFVCNRDNYTAHERTCILKKLRFSADRVEGFEDNIK